MYSPHQKRLEIQFSFFCYVLVHLLFFHIAENPLHLKRDQSKGLGLTLEIIILSQQDKSFCAKILTGHFTN